MPDGRVFCATFVSSRNPFPSFFSNFNFPLFSNLREKLQPIAWILQEAGRMSMQSRLARRELRCMSCVSRLQERRLPTSVGMQLQVSVASLFYARLLSPDDFNYHCIRSIAGLVMVECCAMKVNKSENLTGWVKLMHYFCVKHFSELNYCELNAGTCQNDGKCTSMTADEGSFKCECPSGYRGKKCDIVPPQMYPNATTNGVRPSKVPVTITSMRPQNGTETPSSPTKDEDDDEIDNEAK